MNSDHRAEEIRQPLNAQRPYQPAAVPQDAEIGLVASAARPNREGRNRFGRYLGFFTFMVSTVALVVFSWAVIRGRTARPHVGTLPLHPTYCASWQPNNQPYYVLIEVNGAKYAVLPDTGSSNFAVASTLCSSCDVSPRVPKSALPASVQHAEFPQESPLAFTTAYGTGATVAVTSDVDLVMGPGLEVGREHGRVGLIIAQNTSFNFNLFPARPAGGKMPPVATPTQDTCYNSYAGVLGLAYSSQGAEHKPHQKHGPSSTNGTTTQVVDQMARALGVPNAFTLEICRRYPWNCVPQRRTDTTDWQPHHGPCRNKTVGTLMWGGYSSRRITAPMVFAALTDEIHYEVQLLGARVCGARGCMEVPFPDPINGTTEDDCKCSTPNCDPGSVEYCYFSVVESGAGRIYMNTPRNAEALLNTLEIMDVIIFPDNMTSPNGNSNRKAFFFDKVPVRGAHVRDGASLSFRFLSEDGSSDVLVPVDLDGPIFRHTAPSGDYLGGLVQWGIQGDLSVLGNFSEAKFPTLLGDPFLQGKSTFFDRSRRRVGFAPVDESLCGTPATADDVDVFGANAIVTPGNGCRRGTGSGGGCM